MISPDVPSDGGRKNAIQKAILKRLEEQGYTMSAAKAQCGRAIARVMGLLHQLTRADIAQALKIPLERVEEMLEAFHADDTVELGNDDAESAEATQGFKIRNILEGTVDVFLVKEHSAAIEAEVKRLQSKSDLRHQTYRVVYQRLLQEGPITWEKMKDVLQESYRGKDKIQMHIIGAVRRCLEWGWITDASALEPLSTEQTAECIMAGTLSMGIDPAEEEPFADYFFRIMDALREAKKGTPQYVDAAMQYIFYDRILEALPVSATELKIAAQKNRDIGHGKIELSEHEVDAWIQTHHKNLITFTLGADGHCTIDYTYS